MKNFSSALVVSILFFATLNLNAATLESHQVSFAAKADSSVTYFATFPETQVGFQNMVSYKITNKDEAPAVIKSFIMYHGFEYTAYTDCPTSIAKDMSCYIDIYFRPRFSGIFSDYLTMSFEDGFDMNFDLFGTARN